MSCFRWVLISALISLNLILGGHYADFDLEISRALLTSSVAALSITVAIGTFYCRDFLAEMDIYYGRTDKESSKAGLRIAKDYRDNFLLLFITIIFFTASIGSVVIVIFVSDMRLLKAMCLWAFLSAVSCLSAFILFFMHRLYRESDFFKKRFEERIESG